MPDKLSEKEQWIYDSIRKNPYISQQELAEALGLSRPTIANMISGLIKKGHILGRAYILNESHPIICIGGANIDRKFYILDKAQLGTSNPAHSTQSPGGVARNIAENLGRLGLSVSLITTCGNDLDWKMIEESSSPYMSLDYVSSITQCSTGSYSAVLGPDGDLIIALADMKVYDQISIELIQKNEGLLYQAKCIIADLNCPKDTLQYLCEFAANQQKPLIFIPVSSPKMNRLPADLTGVTWLITNRDETETYFNMEINDEMVWKKAVEKWLGLGITNVVVTGGKNGVMLGNITEGIIHLPSIVTNPIIDVTGAGDAFCAALIYAWLEGKSLREVAHAGIVNASKTLQSSYTVRQDLSSSQLQIDMEEQS